MFNLNGEKIGQALQAYQNNQKDRNLHLFQTDGEQRLKPASILMPLLVTEGRWHLLLTHRSEKLVEHRGQVSFPGGAHEKADPDMQFTALRETYEEIGVAPKDVEVYGDLGVMPIVTGYLVSMFVGQIPWPYSLSLNPDEVESAFICPLLWLADPDHRTIKYRSYAGREFPIIFFDQFEGHTLWGATAQMVINLLEALQSI
jgi:8-oxo-dGTP pyrophosphatase MutT (NUDIX family)